jgi:hypothetical protein
MVAHDDRTITPLNHPDAALRQERLSEGPAYQQYFFGNLDPFRVHAAFWANQLPALMYRAPLGWKAAEPDLRVRHRLRLRGTIA